MNALFMKASAHAQNPHTVDMGFAEPAPSNFKLWGLGFGIRVLGVGSWVSGLGFWVCDSGLWFWIQCDLGFGVSRLIGFGNFDPMQVRGRNV